MEAVLVVILIVHGLVHLFGFAKAFRLAPLGRLKKEITKLNGALWFVASASYLLTAWLMLTGNTSWSFVAFVTIPISQYLIISSWKDARWGSMLNAIIVGAAIVGYGSWRFNITYKNEVKINLKKSLIVPDSILSEYDLVDLPELVQNYVRYAGAVGKPKVRNFRLEFSGKIRKNEDSEWMSFTSQQYNFLPTSTRLFFMKAVMKNFPVTGFHRYKNGIASMDIRLLSLFNVQYQSGKEMGIAETVTFFNDMCCMAPATLIDKRIKWLETGDHKVKAQFTNNGISISAWLYFNDRGELINFISNDRYAAEEKNTMKQLPWSTPLKNYKNIKGHRIPSYAEAIYNYPKAPLCYGTFALRNIEYNCKN